MGLNSGEVVVGRIGDDLRMDYTAQGHVVGLAARVQQLAPPGGISVTEQTARLAAGFFDLLDRGEQSLKGASVPVRVFELRGPGPIRSRFDALTRARLLALRRPGARARAAREGSARRAVRSADGRPGHRGAGRGKEPPVSRARRALPAAWRSTMPGRSPTDACSPFTPSSSWPAASSASTRTRRPRTSESAVGRGLASSRPADPIALDFWLELLGVPDPAMAPSELEPEARRTRLFQSFCDLIQARARREPTLLWVEDLHWLDPASEAALQMLTERLLAPESAGSRVLLLATTRPEYRPAWSARVERLSLAPLAAQHSSALLDDWLGSDPALAPLSRPDRGQCPRQSPLRRGDRSLARRARRAARRARRVHAGRPGRGDHAARDRPGRPRLAHRSALAARQGRAPGRGRGRARGADRAAARRGRSARTRSRRVARAARDGRAPRPRRSLRASTPSGIPSRRKWPTAPSFWIAGAGPTGPSGERCSRSTDPGLRPTPRSSPITSRRRASTSRPRAGTSTRAGATGATTRRME